MTFLTVLYEKIKNLKSPKWYLELTNFLLVHVIKPTLLQLGKEYINQLQRLVIEASKKDWTNRQKFEYVFNTFRKEFSSVKIADHILCLSIEMVISELKEKKILD